MKTIKLENIANGDAVLDMDGKRLLIIDNIFHSQDTYIRATGSLIVVQEKKAILETEFVITSKVVKIEPKDDYIKDVVRFIFEQSNR